MLIMIIGAILIGVTLGLMGSGGSILTVPVLVYVVGHDKNMAVAESMAIVGVIALIAAIPNAIYKQIDWRSVVFFGIPGMVGTFIGAWIGANLFSGEAKLIFFALVMIFAAWSMFRQKTKDEKAKFAKDINDDKAGNTNVDDENAVDDRSSKQTAKLRPNDTSRILKIAVEGTFV